MRNRWKFCIILVIIIILASFIVLKKKFRFFSNGLENRNIQQEEVVVDNAISLKAKEIHDYIRENNYGYCTYDSRCNHEGDCGLNTTFEASKTGAHNTCCATYVSWVLQETRIHYKKRSYRLQL